MASITGPLLMLLLVLALVVPCLWCLKRLRSLAPAGPGQGLALLAQLPLGTGARVVAVRAGHQVLVLGCTGQQVTLLGQLPEGSLAAAGDDSAAHAPEFQRLLQGLVHALARRPQAPAPVTAPITPPASQRP